MNETPSHGLVRAIGRWSLTALVVNTVIGASIFGLPSLIAARLGSLSPLAYPAAGLGVIVIALCLSEVASQFTDAGGPYLYARETMGRFAGIVVGWMTWLSRIAASSAAANLFGTYLVVLLPSATRPAVRNALLVVLIGFLAAANVRGVRAGTKLSNAFTATKVGLLVFFVGSGLLMMVLRPEVRVQPPRIPTHAADWFEAVLLLVYAYGGFEAAMIVGGETRDPRRDAPFALILGLLGVAVLYTSVQYVVISTLPNAAGAERPASDAAQHFLGPWAAWAVAAGTLVALYGYLSANMLHAPRITYALAERGDFPRMFGVVHAEFRTPHISILTFSVLLLTLTLAGNFRWNATLSVFARLFSYATVAIAVPLLRRQRPEVQAFRLPMAPAFVAVALAFCAVLMSRVRRGDVAVLGITAAVALANWVWARGRVPEPRSTVP
jgi:amino acid transporter